MRELKTEMKAREDQLQGQIKLLQDSYYKEKEKLQVELHSL